MSYPAYEKMKDSGVEWIGDVPRHWEPVRFKFVAAFYGGGTPSKDNASYWKGDIPWVSPKDMKCRIIFDSADHISEEALKDSATRLIEKGAVLIVVRSGILKHSIPVAINAVPVAMNQDMKAIVLEDGIEASYLAYLIDGCQNSLLLEWRKAGATVESLEHDYIANTILVLPQSDEQRAIVTFLDRKTGEIEALINLKERQLEFLGKKRQALISHAVTHGLDSSAPLRPTGIKWLGDIPAHWNLVRLKFLKRGDFKYGANESSEMDDPNLPRYIRITDLKSDGSLRDDTFKSLPEDVAAPYILEEGDFLFARSGATVGKSFMYSTRWGRACFAGYLIRYRPDKEKVLPDFFWFYLQSSGYEDFIKESTIQATIQNVSAERYADLLVTLPPRNEQLAISSYLVDETSRIDGIAQTVRTQIDKLRDYRQSLIAAAVTGKIDVRGETDDTMRGVDKKRAG
jgi:type I restriction enzyme S subunit